MYGLAIIIGFHLLGMLLQKALSLPLPANVLGLLLFVIALFAGWIKLAWVETAAGFLTKHMLLFFIPVIVGVQAFFPLIREQWLALGVSWLLSTFVALLATGWTTKAWLAKGRRTEHERDPHAL